MTERKSLQFDFVISAPRSGSTWLATALNAHPEILATENRLFGMFFDVWRNRNGREMPRITADKYLQAFSQHANRAALGFASAEECHQALIAEWLEFLREFLVRRSGKRLVVDKITPYLGTSKSVVRNIQQFFPEARIIHLIRDGRDVVTSGVFDWLGRDPADEDHPRTGRFVHGAKDIVMERFFDDRSLETWCRYWREPITAVENARFSEDRLLALRYEALLDNTSGRLRDVLAFLGADADDDLIATCVMTSDFESVAGRRPGQADPLAKARRGVAGDWMNWFTRRDAERFSELAGDRLISLGYEADDAWIERCPLQLAASM